ncbi:hypothetical protein CCMA1212_002079 [Trichoderma ghanense]|uniref:Uncharacterized protein n=1 Tax=Trichoderma ghanense TaxID=65468 RepID=A0ABY2HDX6_9HYPO
MACGLLERAEDTSLEHEIATAPSDVVAHTGLSLARGGERDPAANREQSAKGGVCSELLGIISECGVWHGLRPACRASRGGEYQKKRRARINVDGQMGGMEGQQLENHRETSLSLSQSLPTASREQTKHTIRASLNTANLDEKHV